MRIIMQYIFSLIFIIQMYVMMILVTICFTPLLLFRDDLSMTAVNIWCGWVKFTANVLVGIKTEVRGVVPEDEVLIVEDVVDEEESEEIVITCPTCGAVMAEDVEED